MLRVATLNVLYHPHSRLRERLPLMQAQARDLDVDVLALQEVDRAAGVDRSLGRAIEAATYRAVMDERTSFPRHWDACSLLSRRTAGSVTRHDVVSMPHHRVVQRILLRRARRDIAILNTHLHYPLDAAGESARLMQVRRILALVAEQPEETPTVIMGDLNGPPTEPYMHALNEAGFTSAYHVVHGRDPARTFPSGLVATACNATEPETIDFIMVRGCRVLSCDLAFDQPDPKDPTLFPSDHLGLVCDLEL